MPYYAIARGTNTGIFQTSDEFAKYKQGKYSCGKKFKTMEEATEYLQQINYLLSKKYYAFADLEFTCSNKIKDFEDKQHLGELLSFGIVITNNKGEILDSMYETIKPKYNNKISEYCKMLTKLTQEEIDNSLSSIEVLEKAADLCNKYKIKEIMCFGSSDYKQAIEDIENYNDYTNYKYVYNFVKRFVNKQKSICRRMLGVSKEVSLSDLKKLLVIDGNVEHHALSDAIDLSKIYFGSIYQPPSKTRVNEYLKQRERYIKYKQYRKIKNFEIMNFDDNEKEIINQTCQIIQNKSSAPIDELKIKALVDDLLTLSNQI